MPKRIGVGFAYPCQLEVLVTGLAAPVCECGLAPLLRERGIFDGFKPFMKQGFNRAPLLLRQHGHGTSAAPAMVGFGHV